VLAVGVIGAIGMPECARVGDRQSLPGWDDSPSGRGRVRVHSFGASRTAVSSSMPPARKSILQKSNLAPSVLALNLVAHAVSPGGPAGGVAVKADAVAHFAAEHLPDGHAPDLSGEVKAGHLDGGNAAAGTTEPALLFDLAENLGDMHGFIR